MDYVMFAIKYTKRGCLYQGIDLDGLFILIGNDFEIKQYKIIKIY